MAFRPPIPVHLSQQSCGGCDFSTLGETVHALEGHLTKNQEHIPQTWLKEGPVGRGYCMELLERHCAELRRASPSPPPHSPHPVHDGEPHQQSPWASGVPVDEGFSERWRKAAPKGPCFKTLCRFFIQEAGCLATILKASGKKPHCFSVGWDSPGRRQEKLRCPFIALGPRSSFDRKTVREGLLKIGFLREADNAFRHPGHLPTCCPRECEQDPVWLSASLQWAAQQRRELRPPKTLKDAEREWDGKKEELQTKEPESGKWMHGCDADIFADTADIIAANADIIAASLCLFKQHPEWSSLKPELERIPTKPLPDWGLIKPEPQWSPIKLESGWSPDKQEWGSIKQESEWELVKQERPIKRELMADDRWTHEQRKRSPKRLRVPEEEDSQSEDRLWKDLIIDCLGL